MSTEQIKTHRYPGVKPFSENERHVFYGRTTDTKKLYQLINLEKLVLLYSKSGLGKSSLLNAGVLPLFDEAEGYTTIKIRLGACYDQSLSPIATSLFKLPETTSNPVLDKLGAGSDTLWLRMKALQHSDAATPKTYILVFDQFEELFTYSQEEIKQFKRQLADLLYAKVPGYISKSITNRLRENPEFLSKEELEYLCLQPAVKVVLSIRSDRMSLLNTLADYLPDIQKNYYELKPLDRDSAIDSIVKPAMDKTDLYLSPSFGYTTDCINKILDYLTQSGQKTIETFQLQTVCQYAENLAMENQLHYDEKKQLLLAEPELLGDLQNIFRTQYDKLIGNIEPLEKQLAARLLIENKLIIDGNRVSLPDVVVMKEKGIDKEVIAYLHDTQHILRSEPNTTGGISYELSHDTLVAPILNAKKEREDKEEINRLEAERQEDLRQQREKAEEEKLELAKTRKRLQIVYALLGVALLALIAAGYFGIAANNAKVEANKQKDTAQQALHRIIEFEKKAVGKKYQGGIIFYSDSAREHGLIAAEQDLPGKYTWESAINACEAYSVTVDGVTYDDWHLPSKDTLSLLYFSRSYVGGFKSDRYWSSKKSEDYLFGNENGAWLQVFEEGGTVYAVWYDNPCNVRPIRSF